MMGKIEIDKGHDIPIYSKTCFGCAHLLDRGKERKCRVFPDDIPLDIWKGKPCNKRSKKND